MKRYEALADDIARSIRSGLIKPGARVRRAAREKAVRSWRSRDLEFGSRIRRAGFRMS
jgi:hypothetical protein